MLFFSHASNLVPGDTNGQPDVFVHDRQTSETVRVSVDSAGEQGNGDSRNGAISSDGRYVAFLSTASNLVAGDTNGVWDAFVHDRWPEGPTPTPTGTATPTATPTLPTPVGGIAELPDVAGTLLEEPDSSGPSAALVAGIGALAAVSAAALGGAGWYARRRRLR